MALPASGAISLSDFNTELGNAAGTEISLNSSDVRSLLGLSSGATASFSDYYGASSVVDIALTIAANTNNYNIFSSKGGTYSAGKSNITLTINSGVTVGSTSTGTYALETGTGWATGDTITIVNNGTVKGRGGDGGAGASVNSNGSAPGFPADSYPNGGAGGTGGNAFRAQFATTFTNNGSVYGGGGGGGGSGGFEFASGKSAAIYGGGGGGGGAGVDAGSGGAGGTATFQNAPSSIAYSGDAGSSGSSTSGGTGGFSGGGSGTYSSVKGGNGGGLGSNGSNGTTIAATGNIVQASPSGGSGGTRGYYQVGSSFINSGGGISGTVAGRSS